MSNVFMRGIQHLFSKHLLVSNTIAASTLLAAGDVITQNIEIHYAQNEKTSDGRNNDNIQKFDWRRTGRMFTVGLVLGPPAHFWYSHLVDKLVKGHGVKVTLKKILADQIIAGPFFCSFFFMGMNVLEGRGVKGGVAEVKEKFLTVYLIDWLIWPPAQFINFQYLPVQYRMLFVSNITLCWNTLLSYIKHKKSFQGVSMETIKSTFS